MTSVSPSVAKRWPLRSQLLAQLPEVVDLAVEDDHDRTVLVENRLIAGHEIDDPQALNPETDVVLDEHPTGVGAAVLDRRAHALQDITVQRSRGRRRDLSGNSTHSSRK